MDYEKAYKDLIEGFRKLLLCSVNENDIETVEYIKCSRDSQIIDDIYYYVDQGLFPRDQGAMAYNILSKYMT